MGGAYACISVVSAGDDVCLDSKSADPGCNAAQKRSRCPQSASAALTPVGCVKLTSCAVGRVTARLQCGASSATCPDCNQDQPPKLPLGFRPGANHWLTAPTAIQPGLIPLSSRSYSWPQALCRLRLSDLEHATTSPVER